MVNGYVTLDLASKNIYNESLNAIKSGKPVMVVDAPNVYFADTIKVATIDDDKVVVITKGGKTITINDVNAVSSEGDMVNHLWEYNFTNDSPDWVFNIILPIDLSKIEIDDADSFELYKNDIQKIYDFVNSGDNFYSAISKDTGTFTTRALIYKSAVTLQISIEYVNISDGTDNNTIVSFGVTDGKVTSLISGEFNITNKKQLF